MTTPPPGPASAARPVKKIVDLETATIRFAGDSGDGMQLAGTQFTATSAVFGNDVSTLPDFPAEIRAPAGTLAGVSAFQICFSATDIHTPGDQPDALVAMNPAALKTNIGDLAEGGIVIVNVDAFTDQNLRKAGYAANPLKDGSLGRYRVVEIPITSMTHGAVEGTGVDHRAADRCKNFFALGVAFWLYDRPLEPTLEWIRKKFAKNAPVAAANEAALRAGHAYAETVELFSAHYRVPRARLAPGVYRRVTGNEATALGFVAAADRAGKTLFYGSYPITPASDILHELSRFKNFGVETFQAEDEIAAICATIGAAYAGAIGLTGSSGPGICLKAEAMGLAVMTELPIVIIDVQRGGPSTGLPTKTEQADLLQALYGRHGECPLPVLAPATPAECFSMAFEAVRIAVSRMVPVVVLTDGYIANGAEPLRLPEVADLPAIRIAHPTGPNGRGPSGADRFLPYLRDPETLARAWALPGTPGLEHRVGGLEKEDVTGNVCYLPENHEKMTRLRQEKVDRIARDIPPAAVEGDAAADLLVVGWGGTYGAIRTAVERVRATGGKVAHLHLRYLNPFPPNVGEILRRARRILVPELNMGQLRQVLRARFLVDPEGLNKIQGKPFRAAEIETAIRARLGGDA